MNTRLVTPTSTPASRTVPLRGKPDSYVEVTADSRVLLHTEGQVWDAETVATMIALGGTDWAQPALLIETGLRHCPHLPLDEILRVASVGSPNARRQLGANPALRPLLARHPNPSWRLMVPQWLTGSEADAALFALLGADPNGFARAGVAENVHCPAEVALALAADPDLQVRQRVLTTTPHGAAAALAWQADASAEDRMVLALNLRRRTGWPVELMRAVADAPEADLRLLVASLVYAPVDLLQDLARDADGDVARAAHASLALL